MHFYVMYYSCSCGTRHIRTEDGNKELEAEMMHHKCPNCGKTVKLDTVSSAVIRA